MTVDEHGNGTGGETGNGVKRLAKDIFTQHRGRLIFLLILTLIAFLSVSLSHWMFGKAISFVQQNIHTDPANMDLGLLSYLAVDIQGIESGLLWWMTVIIVYSLLRGFFLYATGFFRVMTIQHILHYMRSRLFNKVQLMELDWHHKHGTGELVTRTTRDCDMVRAAVESVFQIIEIAAMLN